MPLPFVAIPVIHSAGGYIASSAAAGYIAGTTSATAFGSFVAGNVALIAGTVSSAVVGTAAFFASSIAEAATAAAVATGIISTTPVLPIALASVAVTVLAVAYYAEVKTTRTYKNLWGLL